MAHVGLALSSAEPGLACREDGLGAIHDFELGEDVGYVVANARSSALQAHAGGL
jgi:hypothetical protein